MKLLVIGGGGREHALCWKLGQSPLVSELHCAPGNAGIAGIAHVHAGDAVEIAQRIGADFVVVGPDGALAEGIIDRLRSVEIKCFGPTQSAARLESSKIFCKDLLRKYKVPTGASDSFETAEEARAWLKNRDDAMPVVVKADGLAVGKGVVIAHSRQEAIESVDEVLGIARATVQGASERILVEEFLQGEEVSLLALTDGENVLPLVPAQDHKRLQDGDAGPNTGGMGCYSPVPILTSALFEEAVETILKPTVCALKNEGIHYSGVLYAGLMLTPTGMKVLEFNCRFGDPETQVVLPRMTSDLLPLLLACSDFAPHEYSLNDLPCEWTSEAAVCVVMAAHGYPATVRHGDVIHGLKSAEDLGALVFHAGTAIQDKEIVTNGGRVLGITALGEDFQQARGKCYSAVEKIGFEGAQFRRDIGWRAMDNEA